MIQLVQAKWNVPPSEGLFGVARVFVVLSTTLRQ
jgi:hypothetical protein